MQYLKTTDGKIYKVIKGIVLATYPAKFKMLTLNDDGTTKIVQISETKVSKWASTKEEL